MSPAIASGSTHNLALKEDGTVWSWGDNTSGQLGDGTNDNRTRTCTGKRTCKTL